ncbi:MAG: alpha/beta fold hydrolase [Chloroflexi bacterium]|nr:alpha/beta fold hydrolase [Chloroflexota bacterium]MCI0576930.1 alpha/beta fold hydrolase [Chloroflexota bacterium]MCI0646922.1 alpha/beta fold hydrolase [Chloroflexota bacterium]MCI0731314.1 alpha/beta fold hydrolase [Chloroflexota bacterium]
MSLSLLGSPRVERNGLLITISRRKAIALLVYLAVTGRTHQRDALAALLWPEMDQSAARSALRRHLWALGKALGGAVKADQETAGLGDEAIWLDVAAFRGLLAACRTHGHPEMVVCERCLEKLSRAADLYHDDFLAGFTLSGCPEFDEWQFFQTEGLRRDCADLLARLVRVYSARHDFERAISHTRRWLALDPLQEHVHRQLMQLYDWSGQRNAGLRQYELCKQRLEEELGVRPEATTTWLYEAIRAGNRQPLPIAAQEQPDVQYARSSDHYIAYQVYGDAPPSLVWIAGFVTHLEHAWAEPGLVHFRNRLAACSRLVLFDKRGRGLSDRVARPPTALEMVGDTLAVMDAAGVQRGVLLGTSEGGGIAAQFAAAYPERVAALILYGAFVKGTRSADYPWAPPASFWDQWQKKMVESWGQPQALEVFAPSLAGDRHFRRWWAEFLRMGVSPGDLASLIEIQRHLDVRHALAEIEAPTLVLHRRGDRAVPVGSGRYLAAHIRNARYVELEGIDHFWWVGDANSLLAEIENFLRKSLQSS